MILELTKGIALLLALCFLQSFIPRWWRAHELTGRIVSGLLFGVICVVGMATPLVLQPGVIFDGRSAILAMAGLFGGPVVGAIAATMAAAYRFWLAGDGMWVGLAIIASSVSLGLTYRAGVRRDRLATGVVPYLLFGFLVHLITVAWFLFFPPEVAEQVFDKIALPFILIFTPATAVLGLLLQNIENRTQVENALADSEARFRRLYNESPVMMHSIDRNGVLIDVNEDWLKTLGYERSEVLGWKSTDFFSEESRKRAEEEVLPAFFESGFCRNIPYQLVTKSGDTIDVLLTATCDYDRDGEPERSLSVLVNITKRKAAEAALRESEDRFAKAFHASPAPMSISDLDTGKTLDVNAEWLTMLGYTREEAIGKTSAELGAWTGTTRRDAFIEILKRDGSLRDFEATVVTKSGKQRNVILAAETIDDKRMLLVFHDITERLALERQLAYAQRMEAVGQLTGGLAHDLNNVLAIISGNVELLKLRAGDHPELIKHADAAMKGVGRASDLTRKLLDFSRTEAGETRRVSVDDFIRGMEGLIAKSLTPAISLEMVLPGETWTVDIDPGDFEAALLNLALNARDAMPNGGTLVIETINKVIDQEYADHNPGSTAGDFVMVSVSDNGIGMTPQQAEKAFEPFFTTKEVGKGTGLGLSMVYAFVQRSGGHVKIYTEPGKGTVVRIYLPRADGTPDVSEPQVDAATTLPHGDELVLIVDDELQLIETAESVLGSLGYRTLAATDGEQALDLLRREEGIDLLFSDVIMPGSIDGYRLAMEALKIRPGLRILLTSGFTRKREEFANGERATAAELAKTLLDKPYNIAELATAVRRALDRTE